MRLFHLIELVAGGMIHVFEHLLTTRGEDRLARGQTLFGTPGEDHTKR